MSLANVSTHYISEKVARVRWLPEQLQQSERFVTGSWDMDRNFVRLWRLQSNQYATATESDNVDNVPRCMDKVAMEDDVTAMEFVDKDTLAVSCADGEFKVLERKLLCTGTSAQELWEDAKNWKLLRTSLLNEVYRL